MEKELKQKTKDILYNALLTDNVKLSQQLEDTIQQLKDTAHKVMIAEKRLKDEQNKTYALKEKLKGLDKYLR